jgi:peptidoglycan-N-acetylglucosamine deacetylase
MKLISILLLTFLLQDTDPDPGQSDSHSKIGSYYIDSSTWQIRSAEDDSADDIILITIDDGPKAFTTPGFLDLLDDFDAKAIFFINGYLAEPLPWVVREIIDRGHIIGNHSWGHKRLSEISPDSAKKEILKLNQWLKDEMNYIPRYFRAPFGVMTPYAEELLDKSGMDNVVWSVNSYDWQYENNPDTLYEDAREIADRTISSMEGGNIILMHDRAVSLVALEKIMRELREQGYRFVVPGGNSQ